MFFPRLRRHAKWMFVFLAIALGGGFVIFGVGAGGTGVGDIFRGNGGASGVPSISKAREQTEKSPKNAEAWRELSTALQTNGQTDEAIAALTEYTALKPKDADGLRELAGLYLSQGSQEQRDAQLLQIQGSYASAGQNFPGLFAVAGRSIVDDKIATVISQESTTAIQQKIFAAQGAYDSAVRAYKKIATLQPTDPNIQLELAQAAEQASDTGSAIAAYKKFLVLAPEDPNAPIVKQQLKQLQAASG